MLYEVCYLYRLVKITNDKQAYMYRIVKKYGLTGCVALAILYLSLSDSPVESPPFSFPYLDKVVHFCMYGGLVFIFGLDGCRSEKTDSGLNRSFGFAWCVAVVLGGCMEFAQGAFTHTRTADWFDFLANVAGASAGYVGVRYFLKPVWFRCFRLKKKERPE